MEEKTLAVSPGDDTGNECTPFLNFFYKTRANYTISLRLALVPLSRQ